MYADALIPDIAQELTDQPDCFNNLISSQNVI